MEDVETGYLQAVLAVMCPVGEEVVDAEAMNLEAEFAVCHLVDAENVEASYFEGVAERSGDAEVEDYVAELCSNVSSVAGFLGGSETGDVEN